jgi:hypothetical protein
MFIYLNKKINVPDQTNLACIGWNMEQGWIAYGGDNGFLKVRACLCGCGVLWWCCTRVLCLNFYR